MQTTNTLFQAPNTVIYDCIDCSTHNCRAHYKEIVIAERSGYRVVWCATFYGTGAICTDLYRVEQRRKLDEGDKAFYGHYAVYGPWDVTRFGVHRDIYYEAKHALSVFKKLYTQAEQTVQKAQTERLSRIEKLLSKELDTIHFFRQDGLAYCNDCALSALFKGSRHYMLHSLQTLSFRDIDGWDYGIWHDESPTYADTPEYENGLNCASCGCELVEPMECYEDDEVLDEDELVTGFIAGDDLSLASHFDTTNADLPTDFDSLDLNF